MRRLATTFLLVFLAWLALTYNMHMESIVAGIIVSLIITVICRHLLSRDTPRIILHPMKWLAFMMYVAMMLYAEAIAHLDVIRRIFTGKIRPAIVEIPVGFTTNLGKTLLGNSITITPGTLTVNVDKGDRFFVHTIGYRKDADIGRMFRRYGRMVIR
jgi:multicomponent Na+:H+ antiporter subunit E